MAMSAAAAGSNDTAVNSAAQKLVWSGKIKIKLIQHKNINQEINRYYLCWRNAALAKSSAVKQA